MKKPIIGVICALVLTLSVCNAQATSYTLAIGDSHYVGVIVAGVPADPADEVKYLKNLISMTAPSGPVTFSDTGSNLYTRSSLTPITAYADLVADNGQVVSSVAVTLDVTSIFYVMAKYDAGRAGTAVWYVGDLDWDDTITIPGTSYPVWVNPGGNGYGISSYHTWSGARTPPPPLPEPATLLLVGLGLIGLAGLKRKM